MPEYHQVKADLPSLDFFKNPKGSPSHLGRQRILGVDAAIMFADLLPILEPMGLNLEYVQGPVFDNPIRTAADVANLATAPAIEHTPYIATPCAASMKACPKILRYRFCQAHPSPWRPTLSVRVRKPYSSKR